MGFGVSPLAFATDTNAPADFTIGTYVVAPNPERFGTNLREPFDYNNYTFDPGFEPVTIRRQGTATGGGTNYIENASGATASNWRQIADGFFDGATVRVYRPSTNNGSLQLVRTATVANYVTDGFRRLHVLPVVTNTYTDTTATPGVTYEYQVRAVNSSAAVSTNYSGGASTAAITTAAPLAGSTSASNPTWTNSFYNRNSAAPVIPTGVTATPLSGAVRLDWTANAETDLAGYYIYRRTQGAPQNRIILDSDGPAPQANDIYFVEATYVNPPTHRMHDRLGRNTLNDQWTFLAGSSWPYGQPGSIARDNSTVCPENGGSSSLRLDNPGSHEIRIQQAAFSNPQFHGGYYPALTAGVTYRVEVWLKQSGVPGGTVRFALTAPYNSVSNTFTVTSDWQKFSYLFTAPAMGADATISSITLAFNGPGTLWVDNLLLYEDADGNAATYPPFTLRPAAAQALADYRPGPIRMNTGVSTSRWGVSMDDFLTEEPRIAPQWGGDGGRVRPDDPYKLPMVLRMTRDAGGEPWIIVGTFMDEQEWLHLMEYLAAPYTPGTDTPATKPYAYLRYSQGQQAPWTDVFPRLFIEFGNEQWNPMFENVFANGNTCGQFSEYFFNVAKTSPYYTGVAGKLNFIVNGWHISTGQTSGYGHAASLASPASQFNDIANYIGGWEAGIAVGGPTVNDAGYQGYMMYLPTYIRAFVDQHAVSRDANAAAGHAYKIAVYEGGPGYANPSPGQPYEPVSEVYGKSLAAGVSTLDTYLYNSLKQIDPQCYFTFGGQYNWASHSLVANGYQPHTSWLALQMRNRYASGAMVATAINSVPTLDVSAWTNSSGNTVVAAMPNVPLVQPYAFRNGSNYSVFVLSRRINGDTPVTLRLPFNSVTNAALYTLTGDPRIGNSSNYNIHLVEQAVTNFSQNFTFSMPPGSAYLFNFAGATTLATPAAPTVSISRAPGQTGSTTTPAVRFTVNFSEPVGGFTASDIIIGGASGANLATVTDTGTIAGMTFTVLVTGMTGSGSVTIRLAAGAATGVASGQASLASSATDSGVTYSVPPPINQILAYEDFNVATNATPVSPFLNGVATGSGWTGAWVVQGFNGGTNYTDGFKVIATNALAYSTLRATGNYAGGGGTNFATAGRFLDLGAFSSWAFNKNGTNVIGLSGTELWMSVLMRKNSADDNMTAVILHNGSAAYNAIGNSRLGVGYYGAMSNNSGTRYWSLAVRNAADSSIDVIRSNIPIVAGQTALLVLRMRFGATDTFDLFVNPASLGGDAPATPSATWTTTGASDVFFRALAYSGQTSLNNMALDEIRFGDTYAAVTPPNAAGTVQFSAAGYSINEDSGSATIYVTRASGVSGAATVDYATSNSTATADSDYTTTSGTLTWADGEGNTKSFTVPVLNDNAFEGDETVNLMLNNATGASIGNPFTATLTIVNDDVPLVITTTLPLSAGTVDAGYSQTLAATGSATPYSWSVAVGALPGGLALSGAGLLSGTPANSGTFNFTAQVRDALTNVASTNLTLNIAPALSFNSLGSPAGGTLGAAYAQTLTVSGGTGPFSWSVIDGAVPGGLALSSGGLLSGTPTGAGTFNFTVRVADSAGATATQPYSLAIMPPLLITTLSPLTNGVANVAYTNALAATGGTPGYSWSLVGGMMPGGLVLDSGGLLSGTPTGAGTFNFTAQVTDNASASTNRQFALTILTPGALQFTASEFTVAENGTNAVIAVTRDGGSDVAVSVDYTTNAVTAGTITFAAGETNGTFTVLVADNAIWNTNIVIALALLNPSGGATLGLITNATLTVVNDDPLLAGSLKVSLGPVAAVSAGAQWCVDSNTWQNGGAIVSNLSPAVHAVDFKTIWGWNTPTGQSVTVNAGQTNTITATYTKAGINSPADGSVFGSSSVPLAWDAVAGASQYALWVGSTAAGYDLYAAVEGTNRFRTLTIPPNGSNIHVRLWAQTDGTWQPVNDYTYTAAQPAKAQMTSPANGSTNASHSATFAWDAGLGVSQYALWVGSASNGYDLHAMGVGTNRSQTLALPATGSNIYVRLWSLVGESWQSSDYSYGTLVPMKAAMLNPASGSTNNGASMTFMWNAGVGASQYALWVGSASNAYDLYALSLGTNLSRTLTLPSDGRLLYVRLWSLINGDWPTLVQWQHSDYSYRAFNTVKARFTSLSNSMTLGSTNVTLSWDAGVGASQYALWVGSASDGYDLYAASLGTNLSQTLTLPSDGRRLYVRLWSLINGAWKFNSYMFSAWTAPVAAQMISPANGATNSSASVTFSWSSGTGVSQYALWVGSAPGDYDLNALTVGTNLTRTLTGLPTDGNLVFVRLWSLINGVWDHNDYAYGSIYAGGAARAQMVIPANGAVLGGASTTFTWNGGSGVSKYAMWVGSTPGSYDLYAAALGTNLTQAVTLPVDGGPVYVRLWSLMSGAWKFNDYFYQTFLDS